MITGVVVLASGIAQAQGFGNSKVNGRWIDYYFSQVPYQWTLQTNWVRDNEIDPRAAIVTTWTTSHAAAEISTMFRDWPNSGYVGQNINVDCDIRDINGGYHVTCTHQHVVYNQHYAEHDCSDCWDTWRERRALACHEHGHGVGLSHVSTSTSCMRTNTVMHEDYTFSAADDAAIDGFPLYQP